MRCWRQLGARVVAIEPQPDFVRVLRWLYGRDDGVEIVPQAVGRSAGTAELLVSERTPTVTTLSQAWVDERAARAAASPTCSWSRGERVEVVTLQSLIERYGEPAFVKVDVEGFEAEVLAGLATPVRGAVVRVPAGDARDRARLHRAARGARRRTATTGRSARRIGSRARIGSTRPACARC